jgi:uncharacterized membrane protein
MAFGRHKRAVGTFPTRQEAERALNELKNSGFPMDRVSVIAKDADNHDNIAGAEVTDRAQETEAREGAGTGAVSGTVLGGIGGLLVGLGTLAIPGVGPFLAAGTVATTFAGAGIGAAAGSIVGALTGLGIPEDRAQTYGNMVSRGSYLVIVDGSEEEINRAEAVLGNRGIQEWGIYDAADTPTTATQASAYNTSEPVVTGNRVDTISSNSDVVEVIDRRDQTL